MSNYSPLVKFETEFEGDKITMQLDQLTREVFLGWSPYMNLMDEDGNLDQEMTLKLVNESASMIPQFVKDFRGLKDANGDAIPLQTVVDKVYFIEIVTVIIMKLIEISRMGKGVEAEEVEGKSEGPSQEHSTE